MATPFNEALPDLVNNAYDAMVDIRHDLHSHPELSMVEYRTTDVVTNRLRELGWNVKKSPTETGAVATLKGGKPGKRIMIRADIDGLPVNEDLDISFKSQNADVMHACGHDLHTASILGVADVLAQRQEDLPGEYTVVFQPGEEGFAGARTMFEGGLLEDNPADYVIGGHVTSMMPVGMMFTRPGVLMATARRLIVDIKGKGGHGSMPSKEGSVILAVSALAPRMGEISDGMEYEGGVCACSAGIVTSGTASNVLPQHAHLAGTLRTFTDEQEAEALSRFAQIIKEIEAEFQVQCTVNTNQFTPRVQNVPSIAERVIEIGKEMLGKNNALVLPPVSGSEDFSEFLNRIPGSFMFIGGALEDGSSGMHHSPQFAVDDRAVRPFATVLAASAVDLAQL